MKKPSALFAILALLALVSSCGGPRQAAAPAQAPDGETSTPTMRAAEAAPRVDLSKSETIDSRLDDYGKIVDRYLADQAENKAEAVETDMEELTAVSEALGELAADFSPEQQAKYDGITARLGN